jgi:frataxin-like iron-binding protein CyaY
MIMGNMNAKIETEDDSNQQETSIHSKLLLQLTGANNIIINKSETHSGIWTRTNKQETKKSLIHYIIMSKHIAKLKCTIYCFCKSASG